MVTPATQALDSLGIKYDRHAVDYDGAREGETLIQTYARQVGLQDAAQMLKTMVFSTGQAEPVSVSTEF